ncbi:MAG: lysoplasmalogenase [Planctomycetaceae bacterium]|nr:lysoplasmalogenase [Planctomycetaceae bacterium]
MSSVPQTESSPLSSTDGVSGGTTKPLWVLWLVLLAGGLIIQHVDIASSSWWATFGRMGSSVVLILAGWLWHAGFRRSTAGRYTLMVAIGMTLGAIGDFFNAGLLQLIIPLPDPVIGGIVAFGLGHIAYITGCFDAKRRAGLHSAAVMGGAVLFWQLVSIVCWYFIVYQTEIESAKMVIWPALPYTMLLAGTAGVATGLALQDGRFSILAIGAALFLISDLILAWGMFKGSFPFRTAAVWIPYGGGQMLIVYAITTARHAILREVSTD